MDKFLEADGRDYLHKETIIQLHTELKTLDEWLCRRKGGKTLDLVYGIRLFLGQLTESVYMTLAPGAAVPQEVRELTQECLREDFSNLHLMKQPCNATGVDYNVLRDHCNTVFGELE
jgi:hypothetical protein